MMHRSIDFRLTLAAVVAMLAIGCAIVSGQDDDAPVTGRPTSAPASNRPPSLARARSLFLQGYYDTAVPMYEELSAQPRLALGAAIGRIEIDIQTGKYAEGIARLEAVGGRGEKSADWHAALADLQERVGRYDEAISHNKAALELNAEHYRARWQLGSLFERLGRFDEAIAALKPFDDRMTGDAFVDDVDRKDNLPERAEDLTRLGRGFYRYSVRTRNKNLVERTRHVLDHLYQEAFEFVDADYWPARLAAAELLLEKGRLKEAEGDFKRVRVQNHQTPEAAVGLGRVALENWEFERVEAYVKAALAVNAHCVAAQVLLADTRMTERRYRSAAKSAEEALRTNPHDLPALSVLAAAQWRVGDREASEVTQKRVEAISPRPAILHYALGKWLSAGRQFDEAEVEFKKAIELDPVWPEPRTELGLLYMETGEEPKARVALDASFDLDRFNEHTYNVLQLLDSLEKFARFETEHFIIQYDKSQDEIIVPYFARTLESLFADVCKDFDTRLVHKTMIEIFPRHDGFSVRISGRPFIATVGACTGRVIAMQAPRGGPPFGRFNWASVLRHEFTHTVTLAATRNRIPHWMTEGLAVYEETAPRSWAWQQMLSDAVRRGQLFTLRSIDWGFMRPRRPNDRTMAYAQSEWMCEYMVEKYGHPAVLELLAAFREGRTQDQAFREVLHVKPTQFDEQFAAWATKQIETWGLPSRSVESPLKIKALLALRPKDATLHARMAESQFLEEDYPLAEASARDALQLNRDEPLALDILTTILIGKMLAEKEEAKRRDQIDEAAPFVRRLRSVQPENPRGLKYQAYVEQARQQWPEAIQLLTTYQQRFPQDPDSYRRLAGIHLHRKHPGQALEQLERLAAIAEDEPAVPRQVGMLLMDEGKADEAAGWFRRSLEIDPYALESHVGLGEACLAMKELDEAESEFRVACKIKPDEPSPYAGLSRLYRQKGDEEKAESFAHMAEARGDRRGASKAD